MGIGVVRVRQLKVPVTDLIASTEWYRKALGLELAAEFVEQGVVRGVALADPDTGFVMALRDRSVTASTPDLEGFDVVGFEVESKDALRTLVARWKDLGLDTTEVWDGGPFGAGADLRDPDGTVLRFLADNPIGTGGFVGVEFGEGGRASTYETSRLGKDDC